MVLGYYSHGYRNGGLRPLVNLAHFRSSLSPILKAVYR